MPSVRDLRDRIRSLKNTQQITKAMKQVAAAKIRRAEALQKQSRPYADAIGAMLRDLIANVAPIASAYGRDCFCSASARRIFAAATCFIAFVICCVFFSDRIRSRRSRTLGIVLLRSLC